LPSTNHETPGIHSYIRRSLCPTVVLPQHPDEHRSERPVLLAVDQELPEAPGFRMPPELANPLGALEVWQDEDVEQLDAAALAPRGSQIRHAVRRAGFLVDRAQQPAKK
jgi:hypothetical protein